MVTFYRWIPKLLKFKLILAMKLCFLTEVLTYAPSLNLSGIVSGQRCGLSIPWIFPGGFLEQDDYYLLQISNLYHTVKCNNRRLLGSVLKEMNCVKPARHREGQGHKLLSKYGTGP